jgi:prevent-host-death family protein
MKINIYAAKTRLSQLIDQAAAGEDIVIARSGRPVARLVAVGRGRRRLGLLQGKLNVPSGFDAPLPEKALAPFERG